MTSKSYPKIMPKCAGPCGSCVSNRNYQRSRSSFRELFHRIEPAPISEISNRHIAFEFVARGPREAARRMPKPSDGLDELWVPNGACRGFGGCLDLVFDRSIARVDVFAFRCHDVLPFHLESPSGLLQRGFLIHAAKNSGSTRANTDVCHASGRNQDASLKFGVSSIPFAR